MRPALLKMLLVVGMKGSGIHSQLNFNSFKLLAARSELSAFEIGVNSQANHSRSKVF